MLRRRPRRLHGALLPLLLVVSLTLPLSGIVEAETHVVDPGETLFDIATAYGLDPDLIAQANRILDPTGLEAGQKLVIPNLAGAQIDVPGSLVLRVEPWGTLTGVATPFGVPSRSLVSASGLSRDGPMPVDPRPKISIREHLSPRHGSRSTLLWPTFGRVTTPFGEQGDCWRTGFHEGLDIGTNHGAIVRAADDGVFVEDEDDQNRGYGLFVKLDHGGGLHTLYAHLSRLYVTPRQRVNRGQVIGLTGDTGISDGTHLHFEVRIKGQRVDPLVYLP